MALPGNKNFSDYDNYVTDQNPTTSAQAQDYFRTQAELLKAVIDCDFWQPGTVYQPGDVVKSDSMPNGTEAVMVATKASVTSNVEPSWGEVGGENISDGGCFWKLRWSHWSKEVASVDDMKSGTSNDKVVTPKLARLGQTATNRLPNTAYSVGNVVYVDSNLSVALKCTTDGTTSADELDVSGNNIGDTVTDGSVVWQVCNRTSDVTSVNGKTGDVVVDVGVTSVNNKTGAVTLKESPPDMTDYIVESYRNGDSWYRVWESGWVEQGGRYKGTTNETTKLTVVTFLKPFATPPNGIFVEWNSNPKDNAEHITVNSYSTTQFDFLVYSNNTSTAFYNADIPWYACGQGA